MTMTSDPLTFAQPEWFYLALLAVPLIAVKVIASNASREGLEKITSARLREQLVTARRPLGDWGRFAMQLTGLLLVIVAVARPQKGFTEEMTRVKGRNIIIAIDTSRSMLAQDIAPNSTTSRLTQAKLAAIDLVKSLPDDRIGLIAFAGTAFMQAPMTPDHAAIIETINQLNTFVIERGGTKLSSAIELASDRLSQTAAARNALIMFTDGEDLEGVALKAARAANKDDITIITIGVGSEIPTIIPDPGLPNRKEFLRDAEGELVKSSMDPESLEKIAEATNGIFVRLDNGLKNNQIVTNVLANISYSESEEKLKRTPRERFALPLGLGLACIAAGYLATLWGSRPAGSVQRAMPAMLALGFFCLSVVPADAGLAADAYRAFSEGDFPKAKERYTEAAKLAKTDQERRNINFGLGTIAYVDGEYEEAITAFSDALLDEEPHFQERSHYNLGNTLFRKGEKVWKDQKNGGMKKIDTVIRDWEDAAGHYRSTLELSADNQDAQTNLQIVENLLEKLKELKEPEPEPEDEKEDDEKKDEEEQGDEPEEDKSEPGEESEDKPKDPEESSEGEGGEESKEDGSGDPEEADGTSEGDAEPGEPKDGDPENSRDGEGEPGGENPNGDEQAKPGGGEGDGEETDSPPEKQIDPDEVVDKNTGYSKRQAREALKTLSDEQTDLGLLRRRRIRSQSRRYRDW